MKPLLIEEGKLRIKWEDRFIEIPFNFENMTEVVIYKTMRGMQSQLNNLESELRDIKTNQTQHIRYKFDKVNDKEAEKRIIPYLKEIKKQRPKITIFEISQHLRLPADQVETIMENLEKSKKVKFL